jgi:hypothetical protein
MPAVKHARGAWKSLLPEDHFRACSTCQVISYGTGRLCPVGEELLERSRRRRAKRREDRLAGVKPNDAGEQWRGREMTTATAPYCVVIGHSWRPADAEAEQPSRPFVGLRLDVEDGGVRCL